MLRLRTEGLTLQQIGDVMGCGKEVVHQVIERALRVLVRGPAEELRAVELARCDELMEEALAIVRMPMQGSTAGEAVRDARGAVVIEVVQDAAPKLAAINTVLRVMERRSKLLGLDAPSKTMLTDASGTQAVTFYMPHNGRELIDVTDVTTSKEAQDGEAV